MLQLEYKTTKLAFEYPFEISKGVKTHQEAVVVALRFGPIWGFGEAPAIFYYGMSIELMVEVLEKYKGAIQKYALTNAERYWHYLHHLLPQESFVVAALDIAAWDIIGKRLNKPIYQLINNQTYTPKKTCYTIGYGTGEEMLQKVKAHSWSTYKLKLKKADDISIVELIRAHTSANIWIDYNESLLEDDLKQMAKDFVALGVTMVEQPLPKDNWEGMASIKQAYATIDWIADEAFTNETTLRKCQEAFTGINIKLTKVSGLTPAIQLAQLAQQLEMKVMLGSMNESVIGASALAHLLPFAEFVDIDGPLLLTQHNAQGLNIDDQLGVQISNRPGLGIIPQL